MSRVHKDEFEKDGFDKQKKKLWEIAPGRFIDPETGLPPITSSSDESSSLRFKRTFPPSIEPEQTEPDKAPHKDFKEQSGRHRDKEPERKVKPIPMDSSECEWEGESYPGPGETLRLAVEEGLARIEKQAEKEGEDVSKARRKAIREFGEESPKLGEWLKRKYSEDFPKRELPSPPNWLTDIKNELKNKRDKDRFDMLLRQWDYRWSHRIRSLDECIRLAGHIGVGSHSREETQKGRRKVWVKRAYVFCDHKLNLGKMEDYLGCSRSTIRVYTKTLVSIGTLEGFKKAGSTTEIVYAIGWWHKFREIPFLNKEGSEDKIRSLFGLDKSKDGNLV